MAGMSERIMEPYIVHCLFCRRDHRSLWWDVLQDEIMACREKADQRDLGLVQDYVHSERVQKEGAVEEIEGLSCYYPSGV